MKPRQVYLLDHFINDSSKQEIELGERYFHVVIPHINQLPQLLKGCLYDRVFFQLW